MTARYAIYFASPPGSELEAFGRRVIGRDHITGTEVELFDIAGLSKDELQRITRSARHYGFHATLKAPFVLRDGRREDELHQALETFAAERMAFETPPLRISTLSRWIAFTLSDRSAEMDQLAADCVRNFEDFRAPLTGADIERRRQSKLTPKQDERLLAFGYPHIFDDFHFHMTLAGPLEDAEQEAVAGMLRQEAGNLDGQPLHVDAVALYQQPDRDSPFIQTARFPFQPV